MQKIGNFCLSSTEEKILKSRVVLCKFLPQGNANKNKELQRGSLNLVLIKNYFGNASLRQQRKPRKRIFDLASSIYRRLWNYSLLVRYLGEIPAKLVRT